VGDGSRLTDVVPLTGGSPNGKQRWVGSQVPAGCRRMYLLSPNMRSRLLLLVSGPPKCVGLELLGEKSLLLDWLFGDFALGCNHWCLAFGLAIRGYFRQIGKVSRFCSLRAFFFFFFFFNSPSCHCFSHQNLTIVLKALLKPGKRMSCQWLPYVYVGELVGVTWWPCHYLINPTNGFSS
jgi:hypothetical protein